MMSHPYIITGVALFVLLLVWGIHYTAWQCGRLAGVAEADKAHRAAGAARVVVPVTEAQMRALTAPYEP